MCNVDADDTIRLAGRTLLGRRREEGSTPSWDTTFRTINQRWKQTA